MSLFYMLDCGFVMFFGDRPRFAPYEIQHCPPAHEHVYQASSASEWAAKFIPTNPRPFPELLNAVLSPLQEFPKDMSAAGHFMLLHGKSRFVLSDLVGLHAAIWTQQHNVGPNSDILGDQRYEMITSALKKWRNSWFSSTTIHEDGPNAGFFDEGNFKWWMVANWILRRRAPVIDNVESSEEERVATVYRILKACHLVKIRGI